MDNMDGHISLTRCECTFGLSIACTLFHRWFLYSSSVNVIEGEPSERQMTTGNHTVRDIYCVKCHTTLGWKYVRCSMSCGHVSGADDIPTGFCVRPITEVQGREVYT